jgi:hypothetical protein
MRYFDSTEADEASIAGSELAHAIAPSTPRPKATPQASAMRAINWYAVVMVSICEVFELGASVAEF